MRNQILWLDNDTAYTVPYVAALTEDGYDVQVVPTALAAEQRLSAARFDLLILDIMVPSKTADEEVKYPPDSTEHGFKMGLYFYERFKEKLKTVNTKILALTVRLDKGIRDEFIKAGLDRNDFSTKFELRDVADFAAKVETILGNSKGASENVQGKH